MLSRMLNIATTRGPAAAAAAVCLGLVLDSGQSVTHLYYEAVHKLVLHRGRSTASICSRDFTQHSIHHKGITETKHLK